MTFTAFTGCAGCGKTHQLMAHLEKRLKTTPLVPGQKVLALTFMHGSRKRLEVRLNGLDLNGTKFECTVIDRFAARLLHRWRALAKHMNLGPYCDEDYDGRCGAAAALLANPQVMAWVIATYPIVLLDEAQDLKPERLAMFEALEGHAELYVAADGFQCLDTDLRDSAVMGWTTKDDRHTELTQVHRTEKAGLLAAAQSLRDGQPCPMGGAGFQVLANSKGPNLANFNAAMVLGTKHWDSAAIITPTMQSPQVTAMIARLQDKPIGKKRPFGPYSIHVETSPEAKADEILNELPDPDELQIDDAIEALHVCYSDLVARRTLQWLSRQARVVGRSMVTRDEIKQILCDQAKEASRHAPPQERGLQAMTVHAAKNREFDGVVAIWPYQVTGDDEQKRRLLYNAVTRAKNWCAVICMSDKQLKEVPFV